MTYKPYLICKLYLLYGKNILIMYVKSLMKVVPNCFVIASYVVGNQKTYKVSSSA